VFGVIIWINTMIAKFLKFLQRGPVGNILLNSILSLSVKRRWRALFVKFPSELYRLRRLKNSPSVLKNKASKNPGSISHHFVFGWEEHYLMPLRNVNVCGILVMITSGPTVVRRFTYSSSFFHNTYHLKTLGSSSHAYVLSSEEHKLMSLLSTGLGCFPENSKCYKYTEALQIAA